jgi:ABC-type antimicrobial peptide transport system permease subunit
MGSVNDVLYGSIVTPPLYALVFGWFAALALVLAAVGVYGMMSQIVARRWQEMGVRLALGAEPSDIRAMVMGRAAMMLVAGIVVGLFAAVGIGRWVGSMLYNLGPSDPAALATACGVVLGVGLLAAFIPSQRASRIDPTVLFRVE